jgi:hypothetical protein
MLFFQLRRAEVGLEWSRPRSWIWIPLIGPNLTQTSLALLIMSKFYLEHSSLVTVVARWALKQFMRWEYLGEEPTVKFISLTQATNSVEYTIFGTW